MERASETEFDGFENRGRYLQSLNNILSRIEVESKNSVLLFQNMGHSNVLEPALYVVAESISSALCGGSPGAGFSHGYS